MLTGESRAKAVSAAIVAATQQKNEMLPQSRQVSLSADDIQALTQGLKVMLTADTTYLQGNADIQPAALQVPPTGCTVTTSTGPASGSTVPTGLTGLGKLA